MSGQAMGGSGAMAPQGGQDFLRRQGLAEAMPPTQQGGGSPPFITPGMGGQGMPQPGPVAPPIVGAPPKGPQPPWGTGGSGGVDNHPPKSGGTSTAPPGGGSPPFAPPQMGGGMVDAGYGQGPLNAQGQQAPMGPSSQPGLKQNTGQTAPPIVPQPPVPQPMPQTGQPPKMTVHNPTGNGAQQASEVAAAKRPIPSTKPKATPMGGPPTPQTAGTAKK